MGTAAIKVYLCYTDPVTSSFLTSGSSPTSRAYGQVSEWLSKLLALASKQLKEASMRKELLTAIYHLVTSSAGFYLSGLSRWLGRVNGDTLHKTLSTIPGIVWALRAWLLCELLLPRPCWKMRLRNNPGVTCSNWVRRS